MKILALFLIVLSFSTVATAGISVRDLLIANDGKDLNVSQNCAKSILKLDRKKLIIPLLQVNIAPLNEVTNGKVFYHYTKAEVIPDILKARAYDSIMRHAYASEGDNVAGRGLYLAGNPFSSNHYGHIQASFNINSEARTLQLNIDRFHEVMREFVTREKLYETCKFTDDVALLQTYILQENGVDFYLYDDPMMWYLVINEDIIDETNAIYGVHSDYLAIYKLSEAKRLAEIDVKLFKNENPIARENVPAYSMEYALSQVCWLQSAGCNREVLELLIKYRNYSFIDPFISGLVEYIDEDLSAVLNQELKTGNTEATDAILKAACKYNLEDTLIEKAPWSNRKALKRRKLALCPAV